MDDPVDAVKARARIEALEEAAITLWSGLMDFCKKNHISPASYDELFKLCGAIRALNHTPAAAAGETTPQGATEAAGVEEMPTSGCSLVDASKQGASAPAASALTEAQVDEWRAWAMRNPTIHSAMAISFGQLCDLALTALRSGTFAEGYARAREEAALAAIDGGPCSCKTPCDEYFGYAGVRCPTGTAAIISALPTPGRE